MEQNNEKKAGRGAYMSKYRKENKDKLADYGKKYYQKNKEKLKELRHCAACERTFKKWSWSRHIRSTKHRRNMQQLKDYALAHQLPNVDT